jgi:ribose 5-phosphate isomerase B
VKRVVIDALIEIGIDVEDAGAHDDTAVDYPDIAALVGAAVARGRCDRGVLICGTGIGMSIAANKIAGVRAALVRDPQDARMSRLHNDANVLVLGGNDADPARVQDIVRVWWRAGFEGGRHAARVKKISDLERARRRRGDS